MGKLCYLQKDIVRDPEFDQSIEALNISNKHLRRIETYFFRKKPSQHFRKILKTGKGFDEIIDKLFSRRFGKLLVIYRFMIHSGVLRVMLWKIFRVQVQHLMAFSSYYKCESGETIFFKTFAVYACEPRLCIDPID